MHEPYQLLDNQVTMTWIEARNMQLEVGIKVGNCIDELYIADDADLLEEEPGVRSESATQVTQRALYHCGARSSACLDTIDLHGLFRECESWAFR